jgi:hypothetical protein
MTGHNLSAGSLERSPCFFFIIIQLHRQHNFIEQCMSEIKPISGHIHNVSIVTIFIHLVVCLTRGPKPLPKRALHIVRSRDSSFRYEYPLSFLRSSTSYLRILPRLPVTSIPPFIFTSITCRRRQFLRKMWPIQLDFRLFISCRTLSNTSSLYSTKMDTALHLHLLTYRYEVLEYSLKCLHNKPIGVTNHFHATQHCQCCLEFN